MLDEGMAAGPAAARAERRRELRARRRLAALVGALLLADLALIAAHWLTREDRASAFHLANGASLPSLLQYAELFGAVVLFAWAYRASRTRAHAAAAAIVGVVLADDVLELHEAFGRTAGERLGLPSILGLRSQDPGEAMFAAALGAAVLVLWRWGGRGATAPERRLLSGVLGLTAALAFFAVAVDAVHVTLPRGSEVRALAGVVEDGGELLVSLAMLTLALRYAHAQRFAAVVRRERRERRAHPAPPPDAHAAARDRDFVG